MKIEFDPAKRQATLQHRGLDMAQAAAVFDGATLTIEDDRANYDEPRFITIGKLAGRMVVLVWTPRAEARRIISMRKANDREQKTYGPRLGRSWRCARPFDAAMGCTVRRGEGEARATQG